MNKLFTNDDSRTQLLLRLTLAAVMFPHGAQKLLGWFGGYGLDATLGFFGQLGIPAPLGVLVIMIESVGAVALALGLGSRIWAAGLIAVMAGAAITVHLPHGFFMNWSGGQGGEGFEYHLLAIALSASVVARGAGAFALEDWLRQRLSARRPRADLVAAE